MARNIIHGMKNGSLISVTQVESGLKCGCICAACGVPLVAKKGEKVAHHFAHYRTKPCQYGYETALHLAAKEILSRAKRLVLPPSYVTFSSSGKEKLCMVGPTEIPIDSVDIESRFGSIVPDIIIHSGDKFLFVEIRVTHAIDNAKYKKIRDAGVSTIEIDLHDIEDTPSEEELSSILILDNPRKGWTYNALAARTFQAFLRVSERKKIIERGLTQHVDFCPIQSRIWNGKPYANYSDDCYYCKYHICTDLETNHIWCSGRNHISTLADLKSKR